MNTKIEFDAQFSEFIDWLIVTLPVKKFNLNFKSSKYVPGGLKKNVLGFENLLPHYIWSSKWVDTNGLNIKSSDWVSTKFSLKKLSEWISKSVIDGNENETLKASKAILQWGGVRGALSFLESKSNSNNLIKYLNSVNEKLTPNSTNVLCDLDENLIERFDAGMTKVHALLDLHGSPIYDSRVGAAISALYAEYCFSLNIKSVWSFPTGAARGDQIRSPSALCASYSETPHFYKDVSKEFWAKNQLVLGWLINSLLGRCNWFLSEGSINKRAHACEASLFMIGYDLRCLTSSKLSDFSENKKNKKNFWAVPSGHNISNVSRWLHQYSLVSNWVDNKPDDRKSGFKAWLVNTPGLSVQKKEYFQESTAGAYCYPFRDSGFDSLLSFTTDELAKFSHGGLNALKLIYDADNFEWGSEESEYVCLIDAYLYGFLFEEGIKRSKEILVSAEFAGTLASANTLLAVGKTVAKHFGLLDASGKPNEYFFNFFGEENNEIKEQLMDLGAKNVT